MSSVSYLTAFVIILGWEGPFYPSVGMLHESQTEILISAVFTLIFWGFFGWWALVYVAKILTKKVSP
jgi:hypothetical protein